MTSLCVIATSDIADGTRGALTRWMLEPAPAIYIGTLTQRVRQHLWSGVCESIDEQNGWAVLVHPHNNEQGFDIQTHGTRSRQPVNLDGLTLIAWKHERATTEEEITRQ